MYLSIRIEFSKTEEPGPQLQFRCLFLFSLTIGPKHLLVLQQERNAGVSDAKEGGDHCLYLKVEGQSHLAGHMSAAGTYSACERQREREHARMGT